MSVPPKVANILSSHNSGIPSWRSASLIESEQRGGEEGAKISDSRRERRDVEFSGVGVVTRVGRESNER